MPPAPTCEASDATSGLAGDCTVEGYSTAVGEHTIMVRAIDLAANEASRSITYTVTAAVPDELTYSSGDAQAAAIGTAYAKAPTVVVRRPRRQCDRRRGGALRRDRRAGSVRGQRVEQDGRVERLRIRGGGAHGRQGGRRGARRGVAPSSPGVAPVLFTEAVRPATSARADLVVSVSGVPAQLTVGQVATVTVKVRNAGPQAASSVRTVLDPGAGLEVAAATGGTISPPANAASWTATTLASGATVTYTAKVKAPSGPGAAPLACA